MKIIQQLTTTSAKFGRNNKKLYITIHETGNFNKGANAKMHANLQSRGFSESWHWTVDDTAAYQSFTHDYQLYHAGDGAGNGGLNSIGIEICVNSDGNYLQAVRNAAELVKKIMKDEGISIMKVVQHNHWSGKNCPQHLRAGDWGINWNGFIQLVQGASLGPAAGAQVSKPTEPSINTSAKLDEDGYLEKATIAKLQQILGTPVDGYLSEPSEVVRALQRKLGVAVDGWLGKDTITALQKYLGTGADGVLFEPSPAIKEMQKRLNNGTFKPTVQSSGKSIDTLVQETKAGKHGNGEARKKSLGSNYDAVMKVINGGSTVTVAKKKHVYLPKSAKTWRVYKTGGPYTTGNEVGFLAPAQYGGLNYEIIKTLATDVYEIKTGAFGNVAIYAAKSTGATIK